MADRRSKRQKLQAMANQSVSPHEAKIAQEKLAELPPEEPPEQPPFFPMFSFNMNGITFNFQGGGTVKFGVFDPVKQEWVWHEE